ncbi:hypothetical protein B0O80DRAFT_458456 [Mortierella sp. GBAus27b]|nr:hypothetical protein B0O80DRAFT_458456 [Mortierella sp. GBAus27b]
MALIGLLRVRQVLIGTCCRPGEAWCFVGGPAATTWKGSRFWSWSVCVSAASGLVAVAMTCECCPESMRGMGCRKEG